MANKSKYTVLALLLVVAFVAGGLLFRQLPDLHSPKGEVEELYQTDGESLGIFDNIPEEDMVAAEAVAAEALGVEISSDELEQNNQQAEDKSSQILADLSDIVGFAPKEDMELFPVQEDEKEPISLDLTGKEVVAVGASQPIVPEQTTDEESRISMIVAPVKSFLIKNTDDYKDFKTRARGGYPEVNFGKQMLVVLESDSNLPDNIFEIVSAEEKDGKLLITYRVNVFGLDKKTNTHTVMAVKKTDLPLELKQVL